MKQTGMKQQMGFSLVEVVIAIVVLALLGTATMLVNLSSMRSNADSRARIGAIAAGESWLERFRAKNLRFELFESGKDFAYGHEYSTDSLFTVNTSLDASNLNEDWQDYRFFIQTATFSTEPIIWRVTVETYYRSPKDGGEGIVTLKSLVEQ